MHCSQRFLTLCHSLLRWGILAVCAFLLTFGASAQNSAKIQKMKTERAAMKKQIGEMESLLSTTKKDVASQMQNLALLDAQITERQNYIQGIQTEADSLQASIGRLEEELVKLKKELSICKDNYRQAMSYVFRSRKTQSRWMFVLRAKDFRQMYRRLRYASQYSKYQRAQGEVIKRKETEVKNRQLVLQAAKSEKDSLLTEQRSAQEVLKKKNHERQSVVDNLGKKQKQIQKQLNSERKKYNRLNEKIDRLIQEEIAAAERRRKAELAKNKSKGKGSAKTPNFQAADDTDRKLSANFSANKGRLPIPITGAYAVTSHFGKYNVQGLKGVVLDNKGVNLTGRTGAQARSIFDGEVCSVVSIGGTYAVIIRHGSYFSVYSNLSRVSVRQGQKVTTRQIIGNISRDASGNCTLHFQLRKNTQKLNPMQWIGK